MLKRKCARNTAHQSLQKSLIFFANVNEANDHRIKIGNTLRTYHRPDWYPSASSQPVAMQLMGKRVGSLYKRVRRAVHEHSIIAIRKITILSTKNNVKFFFF